MRAQQTTLEFKGQDNTLKVMSSRAIYLGPVVQSVVSLTSSLRVISLTVLADSIYNILIFFAEKNVSSFCTVSLDINFNKSLTNDIVSFEQLGPECG